MVSQAFTLAVTSYVVAPSHHQKFPAIHEVYFDVVTDKRWQEKGRCLYHQQPHHTALPVLVQQETMSVVPDWD
jgi:hypothetical protein